MWLPRFAKQKIELRLLPASSLPLLHFDSYKIQRVVSNLLHNALKFTPEGGTIEVGSELYFWERRRDHRPSNRQERRSGDQKNFNSVRLWVADSGVFNSCATEASATKRR